MFVTSDFLTFSDNCVKGTEGINQVILHQDHFQGMHIWIVTVTVLDSALKTIGDCEGMCVHACVCALVCIFFTNRPFFVRV